MSYNRFHLDGSLLSGQERWSVSWAVSAADGNGFNDPGVMQTKCDEVMDWFGASTGSPADLKSAIGITSTVDRVRCYFHPDTGQPATVSAVSLGAPVAGSGACTKPPQCALVVSLLTGRPGRSYRGRFYWPAITQAMTASGKWGGTSTTTLANAFKALLLESVAGVGTGEQAMRVVVASAATGDLTAVSSVRVGDVVDTQRRRRDKMVETYASVTI